MQQVLAGDALTGHHEQPTSTYCFSDPWDKQNGQFRPCFLPVIACIPALFAAVILFSQACGLLVPWRPRWTRPFVLEIVENTQDELLPRKRKHSFLNLLLGLAIAVAAVLQCVRAIPLWPALSGCAPAASLFAALGLVVIQMPRKAPFSVLAILLLQSIATFIMIMDDENRHNGLKIASLSFSVLGLLFILCMPLRDPQLPEDDISRPMTEPTAALRSPEDNLSLWQFMSVSWMTPLLRIGYKRQLHDEDVWKLAYEFQHQRLHDNFRLLKGTVVRRLVQANAIDLIILTTLGLLELVLQYSTPLLLQLLLSSMEDFRAPKRAAIIYAALSLAVRLVAAQSGVFSLWFGRRCYERSRGEMITMLYEKTLGRKISFAPAPMSEQTAANGESNGHTANGHTGSKPGTQQSSLWQRCKSFFHRKSAPASVKEPASMGKILNLMRNDVYEVAQRFWEFQEVIKKPLGVVFSITLVVHLLGWPSMIAVVVMLLTQALNVLLARIMIHYEKKRRLATDGKLQVISQFVEATRHLRWYGWQGSWLTQIISARQQELNLRVITAFWNLVIAFVNTLALDLTPTIAFFAYTVIAKQPLRVDIAFPAMALFQMMTTSLRDLPNLIIVLINAWVAVGRIEDFMAEPDKEDLSTEVVVRDRMLLDSASFAWPGSEKPVLKEVDISFPKGLTMVVGEVGSGKSAMLQAILGELDLLSGQLMRPDEPIGYCAQTPWLQSMSIRDNILFSAPYEDERYKAVIAACALTPDLADFKAGDLSMIGENGIGLSGGQRARIALARALYSKANILLLDDPLSALDQQTAELIVVNCFGSGATYKQFFQGRTIVLTTHRTDLTISRAQKIVEMQDGRTWVANHLDGFPAGFYYNAPQQKASEMVEQPEQDPATVVAEKFIEDECREHGGVKASVYWEYVKAGKLIWWFVLVLILALYRIVSIGEAWFLKSWGEAYNQDTSASVFVYHEDVLHTSASFPGNLPRPDVNIKPWLLGFFLLGLGKSLCFILSRTVMIIIIYTAAKNMFIAIMDKVAGATFRFYDVTPIGRLMNRMTSDINVIDGNISMQFQSVAWLTLSWIGSVVVIGSVTPTFLVFTALLAMAFILIFMRFIPTSQSLRRLEMVSLTPLMSNFGTLLTGLTTVRAFRVQREFQSTVVRVVDNFQKMDHFYWSLQAWLMFRYDVLSAVSFFLITLLALATNVSAGLTAFVLIAANKLVTSTHQLCKQYGQLQMDFVSVERVVELLYLEQEPKGSISPPAWWPAFSGDINFDKVTIKYAAHMDPALANISFTVKGGSKTAVIGRTGSGKSTLALSLLAAVVPEAGSILVDNIDLAEVDKQLLRTRVTFVAQDPVLFAGDMRKNLDPIDEHTDDECESVLRRVCKNQHWALDTKIEAGGRNLSQGQRQLVGIARAVLRRSAIIILDEATASIDRETAMQIQQVMHEEMKSSTVITIAHRLEAVRNADYCIELANGSLIRAGPAAGMFHESDV